MSARALAGIGVAAVLLGLIILADPPTAVAAVPAFLLAFVLPGAAFVGGLLPREPFDRTLGVVVALAVSTAATVLVGAILAVARIPLTREAWALGLVEVVLILAAFGVLRRLRRISREPEPSPRRIVLQSGGAIALSLVAVVVALGATASVARTLPREQTPGTTELWATAPATGPGRVALGVRSGETGPRRYRLEVHGGATRLARRSLALEPGEDVQLTFSVPRASEARRVTVTLYLKSGSGKNASERLYRRVRVTVEPARR